MDKSTVEDTFNDAEKLYIREIMAIPLLEIEEERELIKMASMGDLNARKKIIESNLRLVASIASKHLDSGIPFLDLAAEGNFGLLMAINKYDIKKNVKFATYATYWINNYIFRYIAANAKSVRIPLGQYNKLGTYRKVINVLTIKLNREPTVEEIIDELALSKSQINVLETIKSFNMISLDELIGEDNDTSIESILANFDEQLDEKIFAIELKNYIDELFYNCGLNDMEINVLRLKYGFINDKKYTDVEIGKMYKLTKQRIYQIERKALKKIRLSKYAMELVIYTQKPSKSLEKINNYRHEFSKKV